jgi:hypothetical protein
MSEIEFTRQPDGTYAGPDGFTIRRKNLSGTGQRKPFERVRVKARSYWSVEQDGRFERGASATLEGAKTAAVRQVQFARARAAGQP